MSFKKVLCWSLLIGTIAGFHVCIMNSSLDYKVKYLKRKLNYLSRKVDRTLSYMSEENLKKYKDEIVNGYENIKNKIDNLTIKDIKDAGSDLLDSITQSIKDLKQKLITYTN